MIFIWHLGRVLLFRAASLGLAAFWAPAGKMALAAAMVLSGFVGWSAWQRGIGRDAERAAAAAISQQAEMIARLAAEQTARGVVEMTARDDAELARIAEAERQVRDESVEVAVDRRGSDVLWRADDRWLRAKR